MKKVNSYDNKSNPFKNFISEEEDDVYPSFGQWIAMTSKEKLSYLHDSLLELYLNIKMRNFEKDKQSIDSERVDEELAKLK